MEAATGYCTAGGCDGHMDDPKPGHFWSNEEPEMKARAAAGEEGGK